MNREKAALVSADGRSEPASCGAINAEALKIIHECLHGPILFQVTSVLEDFVVIINDLVKVRRIILKVAGREQSIGVINGTVLFYQRFIVMIIT